MSHQFTKISYLNAKFVTNLFLKKGIWNKSSEAKLAAILHAENDGIFSDVMEIPDNISRSKYRFKYKFNEIFPNKPNG